jgi:secondary thiamine-phosphate synthase enzyme
MAVSKLESKISEEKLMKTFREELWFNIPTRTGFVNITRDVEAILKSSGIREGLCLVNAMHITASVFINDDESGLHHDYMEWLEGLASHEPTDKYWHNRTGEDNADAHLKIGLRTLGADLLWRVRRSPPQARVGEDHW